MDPPAVRTLTFILLYALFIVGGATLLMLIAGFYYRPRAKWDPGLGQATFRYSLAWRLAALALWFLGAIWLAFLSGYSLFVKVIDSAIPWVMFGSAFVVGMAASLDLTRTRVVVTEGGIESISPWRSRRSTLWVDITQITYSALGSCLVVKTRNSGTIRVNVFLGGASDLWATFKARLRPEVYAAAESKIEERGSWK